MGNHKNAQPECRKRLRESGSQTNEDSLQEEVSSGHCCEVKFAEVNTKLDRILHSLTELEALKHKVSALEKESKDLMDSAKFAHNEITDLKATVIYACSNVERLGTSIHVQYTRTESDRLGYATVRLTGSPIARDLEKYTEVFREGVNVGGSTPSDTDGHDPSLFVSVRLSGSPIARDLKKYTEVFTEGVKCWRIDSIGHGRTRPVSLFVGSTERKSDRERLRKIQ